MSADPFREQAQRILQAHLDRHQADGPLVVRDLHNALLDAIAQALRVPENHVRDSGGVDWRIGPSGFTRTEWAVCLRREEPAHPAQKGTAHGK